MLSIILLISFNIHDRGAVVQSVSSDGSSLVRAGYCTVVSDLLSTDVLVSPPGVPVGTVWNYHVK